MIHLGFFWGMIPNHSFRVSFDKAEQQVFWVICGTFFFLLEACCCWAAFHSTGWDNARGGVAWGCCLWKEDGTQFVLIPSCCSLAVLQNNPLLVWLALHSTRNATPRSKGCLFSSISISPNFAGFLSRRRKPHHFGCMAFQFWWNMLNVTTRPGSSWTITSPSSCLRIIPTESIQLESDPASFDTKVACWNHDGGKACLPSMSF